MSRISTKIQIAFAKNGSEAIILREGPAKWTRMFCWNTATDKLTPGQWLHSKIPNFAINSDGSLVLCFVQSYRAKHKMGTWIALSKPPWFSALAVWEIGDSWGGGCCFISDQKIFVSEGIKPLKFQGKLPKRMSWTSDRTIPVPSNGWTTRKKEGKEFGYKTSKTSKLEIYTQQKGVDYKIELNQVDKHKKDFIIEDAHRADFDTQGRLVFTKRDGKIYRVTYRKGKFETETVFELANMKPESIRAPASALKW